MSLQAALSLLLDEYPKAMSRTFAGDPVAEFVRKDVPQALRDAIGANPRYVTRGSPGQGAWAQAPWAAVFDRFVTETAQDGYYVVYLVREDFAGIHLSLTAHRSSTELKRRMRCAYGPQISWRGWDPWQQICMSAKSTWPQATLPT